MFTTIARACVGGAVLFGAERGAEMMWPERSVWLWWGGASFIAGAWLIAEAFAYRRHRKPKIGPEIRLTDTITYREQPDGSRVLTETKLVKPVRLRTKMSGEGAGSASLRPPRKNGDE